MQSHRRILCGVACQSGLELMDMLCNLESLRQKEVIDVRNGEKLGYIDDIELDAEHRTVHGFWIYGKRRFFGLLRMKEDVFVPSDSVQLYGRDVLLAEMPVRVLSDNTKKKDLNKKYLYE
jgi:YlmC/YmxH family sporulation protein